MKNGAQRKNARMDRLAQHPTSASRPANLHCTPAPRRAALRLVALCLYTMFGSIARTCLACLNIAQSCASPKKPKDNAWSLIEKQMWHGDNSVFVQLDHSEA
jgi:hypothetical protein